MGTHQNWAQIIMKQSMHDGLKHLAEGYKLIKEGLELIDIGTKIMIVNGKRMENDKESNKRPFQT